MVAVSLLSACIPETFTAAPLSSFLGAEIISIEAAPVLNTTVNIHYAFRFIQPSISAENLSFCNITISYTHPGTDDRVNVETWLPAESEWNERYYAVGGGGFAAGRFELPYSTMAGAVAEGYATSTTDAGLGPHVDPEDASSWVLLSPGNVDWHKVQDLGSVSLNDQVSCHCLLRSS